MATPRIRRATHPPRALLAAVAFVAAAIAIALSLTGVLDGAEQGTLDARYALRPAHRPSDVVVVGVGDETFDALGIRWPFPRRLHAEMIRRLRAAGARGIVYDVQFTERTDNADDMALYRALGPDIVLATSETDARGNSGVLGGDENLARVGASAANAVLQGRGSELTRVTREVGGLPTIAVTAARRLGGARIPTMPSHGALIDFRGPPGTVPELEFSNVLRGRFDPREVRGKIVVVGATASTLQDVHAVPTSSSRLMTGPEVEANAIWTVLHGDPLRNVSTAIEILLIALLASLAPALARATRTRFVALTWAGCAIVFAIAAQVTFGQGIVLPVVAPLVGSLISLVATLGVVNGAEISARLRVVRRNDELEERVRERTEELRQTQVEIVQRLGNAAERRGGETGAPIERMSRLCERLALALGMTRAEAEQLRHASAMHDVGKIGLSDDLLRKPGPYSTEERRRMQEHATIGSEILAGSDSALLQLAEEIARTHHERWDGRGYPAGLQGEEIPLSGRICTICDVFDALVSPRPYKRAWPVDEALRHIAEQAALQFDPALVPVFLSLAPELRAIAPLPDPRAELRAA